MANRVDHDKYCLDLIQKNPNMLVPWYLINSYLYYIKNTTIIQDTTYDLICKRLDSEWDDIKHKHKNIIDRFSLKAGTGFTLKESDYPTIVKDTAMMLLKQSKG